MKRVKSSILAVLFSVLATLGCKPGSGGNDNLLQLMVLLALDPCFNLLSPATGSGLPTNSLSTYGALSVKGRLVRANGTAVNGAVVMVDGGASSDANHYSSHTGIGRDGYFEIGGILVSDGPVIVSVEPLSSQFAGRIDTHLDCYTSGTFTAGWYRGDGYAITTTRGSALSIVLTGKEGQVIDLGTVKLLE